MNMLSEKEEQQLLRAAQDAADVLEAVTHGEDAPPLTRYVILEIDRLTHRAERASII